MASRLRSYYGGAKPDVFNPFDEISIRSTPRVSYRASKHIITWERICQRNTVSWETMEILCGNFQDSENMVELWKIPESEREKHYVRPDNPDSPFMKILEEMKVQRVDLQKGDIIQIQEEDNCVCGKEHFHTRNERFMIFDGDFISELGADYGAGDGNIPFSGEYTVPDKFPSGYWNGVLGYFEEMEQVDPNLIQFIQTIDVTPGVPDDIPWLTEVFTPEQEPIYIGLIHGYWKININRNNGTVTYSQNLDDGEEIVYVFASTEGYEGALDEEVIDSLNDIAMKTDGLSNFMLEDYGYRGPLIPAQFRKGRDENPELIPMISVLNIT